MSKIQAVVIPEHNLLPKDLWIIGGVDVTAATVMGGGSVLVFNTVE